MSALAVVPSGRAAAYGAEELKQAAHKYGFIAVTISVLIHASVIGLYFFIASLEETQINDRNPGGGRRIFVDVRPPVSSGYTLPLKSGSRSRSIQRQGIPVPVVEDPIEVETTIDSDTDPIEGTGPVGDNPLLGGNDPGGIIDCFADDTPPAIYVPVEKGPSIVRSVTPAYPELALKAGIEGKVFVKIWVDKQVKPREVDIIKSDYEIFNEAALEAAKKFLFTPAYMNNGPVSVWVSVPFTFKLAGR